MINKIYQDFTKDKLSQENNYNVIMAKTRKTKKMFKFSHVVAGVFTLAVIGFVAPAIYAQINWNIEFKDYQYRPTGSTTGSLQKLKDSEYAEIVDMDYLVQDGIGIKIDTLLKTVDTFNANVTFKFPQDTVVDAKGFDFGFAVYDENNNIYTIDNRISQNIEGKKVILYRTPFILKELGLKYNKYKLYDLFLSDNGGNGLETVNEAEKTITKSIHMRAKTAFPESKKIFIRIYDLGYRVYDINEENIKESQVGIFDISDSEWIFEIDVPEKFHNVEPFELALSTDVPEYEFEKITISETNLVMEFNSPKYVALQDDILKLKSTEYFEAKHKIMALTDGDGNIYEEVSGSRGEKGCKLVFDVGKDVLQEKGLFLNFTIDDKTYTSELVKK